MIIIKKQQKIEELFNKSISYDIQKEIGYMGLKNAINYIVTFDDCSYDLTFIPDKNSWYFGFMTNGNDFLNNNGKNFKIFNICIEVITNFITEYNPSTFIFEGRKMEPAREKLYTALIKRMKNKIESMGYKYSIKDADSLGTETTRYTFTKRNNTDDNN